MTTKDHSNSIHPSFSSTLLDHIYRSFDDNNNNSLSASNHRSCGNSDYTMTTKMKKSTSSYMDRFAVDQWIQTENINLHRRTPPTLVHYDRRQIIHSSSTSSSDSSSGVGGVFSSSDAESVYGSVNLKPKRSAFLKPIRTTQLQQEILRNRLSDEIPAVKKKQSMEGNLQRRALKLYRELKKMKQPISPGGKLTSFLNSLFNSGTAMRKPNISSLASISGCRKLERDSPAMTTSRSCLSKTPSSAGRIHRSVRFVDDEKCDVAKNDSSILANDEEFKMLIKEKQRRVEEVAKELLDNYRHLNKNELKVNIIPKTRKFDHMIQNFKEEDEDEDEDDEISCGSSDLFELENFLEIGMEVDRYGEELPVYETTHVGTNKAIANGFIF